MRDDKINEEALSVDYHFTIMCKESNIGYVDNRNISLKHFQRVWKLGDTYLNEKEAELFRQNFFDVIYFRY